MTTGDGPADTRDAAYAARLDRLSTARWKQVLDVQAPYRWNLRRLRPGRVLDVGCGIGRNLAHLDGAGVGVDHNEQCVAQARARGLEAYTPAEFAASAAATPASYDSLLFAHVLEHLSEPDAAALVREYLPYLRPSGRVLAITPQERGQASDASHRTFMDFAALDRLAAAVGLVVQRRRSFPFPRPVGRVFPHNEFVAVLRRA